MLATSSAVPSFRNARYSNNELTATTRISIRSFFLGILCLATTPGFAAPILIVQFSHGKTLSQVGQLPTTAPFQFRAYEPNVSPTPVYLAWADQYAVAQVGMSFFAPPEIVTGASAALLSPTSNFDFQSGAFGFTDIQLSQVPPSTEVCSSGLCTTVFVQSPSNYYATAVERIIDKLVLTPTDENMYVVQGAQTIRLWGERIPEPNTAILFALYMGTHVLISFPIRRRQARRVCGRTVAVVSVANPSLRARRGSPDPAAPGP